MLAASVVNATVEILPLGINAYHQLLSNLKLTHFNKVFKNFKYVPWSHTNLKYPCMNPSGVFFYLELWYLKPATLPSNLSAINLKLFVGYKKPQLCGCVAQSFYAHFLFQKTAPLTSMLFTHDKLEDLILS